MSHFKVRTGLNLSGEWEESETRNPSKDGIETPNTEVLIVLYFKTRQKQYWFNGEIGVTLFLNHLTEVKTKMSIWTMPSVV